MKKLLTALSLVGFLTCIPSAHAWDKKDKALLIGSASVLMGGELIRQAILHNKDIYQFFKDKPHVLLAGLGLTILAGRQYKDAVIQPLIDWYKSGK